MDIAVLPSHLVDQFGRTIDYLRVSITDRCDFRCVYCMSEDMTFLPRAQILSMEEIYAIVSAFVALGVKKVRITGGEPLVRKGAMELLAKLGKIPGLQDLVLTTNGSQLATLAPALKAAGVKRINISLDTLDPEKFKSLTRTGDLATVLAGIAAAKMAGFESIKLNAVILQQRNHQEVVQLVKFAIQHALDISFIEEMPLGVVTEHDRFESYYPSHLIRQDLSAHFTLLASEHSSGGPSRYYSIAGTTTQVGFISPHSENFCSTCNRVRLTAEGRLLLCLGNEHAVDLKAVVRAHPGNSYSLKRAIVDAMQLKPEKHEFNLQEQPIIFRHMNVTGG